MKRLAVLTAAAACLLLSGCSAAAFWLSGCGSPAADLVVVNDSGQDIWSITLDYEDQSQGVRCAGDHALLERGQTYGLELEGEEVTVTLSGRSGRTLASQRIEFSGERLYLTLGEDGAILVSKEWNSDG